MPIRIACPDCGANYRAPDHFAGRTMACQKCQGNMTVPAALAAAVDEMMLAPLPPSAPRPVKRRKQAAEESARAEESESTLSIRTYVLAGGAGLLLCLFLVMLTIYPFGMAIRMTGAAVVLASIAGCAAGGLWAVVVMFSIDPNKAIMMLVFLPLGLQFIPALDEKQRAKFNGPADVIKWSIVVMIVAFCVAMAEAAMNAKWV